MTLDLKRFFPIILVIFHIIGLVLFAVSETASDLTWFNLTLCGLLVFIDEGNFKKGALLFTLIFLVGYLIELIGTKTGMLFGEYTYGEGLGWRVFGVSIMIGVNWYAVVLAAANFAKLFKIGIEFQALLAGLFCVGLDFVIEPIAIKFDFWSWGGNGEIPIFNYLTWYVFAVLLSLFYLKYSSKLNKTALSLFFVWLLFFVILRFV